MITCMSGRHDVTPQFASEDARWRAVLRRDRRADGLFWYSVETTRIYCRPSCPARRPLRRNVRFHASVEAAVRDGLRPCRRCNPDGLSPGWPHTDTVARACRLMESAEEPPSLEALARGAGLSRFHFHRLFKAATGVTPRAYAAAVRAERVRRALAGGRQVTEACYESGFNSSGRFYAASPAMLGMAPRTFRSGGEGMRVSFAIARCSLGRALVGATERGVCAIFLGDDPDALVAALRTRFPKAQLAPGGDALSAHVEAVVRLVDAPWDRAALPLDIRGTAFQARVWDALREIPAGTTVSYGELARRLGAPSAVRAVARACGANPVAVAVPCHRVVGGDGSLTGYRWGLNRKRHLLEREANRTPAGGGLEGQTTRRQAEPRRRT